MQITRTALSRRGLLQVFAGTASVWASPALWAQNSRSNQADGRLVFVFLRGAYDGLSALVPHGDADY